MAGPAASEDAARALLASVQRSHSDATHHCSAWRLRDGLWRANDAGEPSGSAGAAILGAIDAAKLTDVVVVVARYFGGTKLGVGGLIRAYGEAAMLSVESAPRRRGIPAVRIVIRYSYSHTAAVMRALDSAAAVQMEHGYAEVISEGETTAVIPRSSVEDLTGQLREQTAGEVQPEQLGDCNLYRHVTSLTPDSA